MHCYYISNTNMPHCSRVCIVSVLRTLVLARPVTPDTTWVGVTPVALSMVEANSAVICSCLPMVWSLAKPLLAFIPLWKDKTKHTIKSMWTSTSHQTSIAITSTSQSPGKRRSDIFQNGEQCSGTNSTGDAQCRSPCSVDDLRSERITHLHKNRPYYQSRSTSSNVSAGSECVCPNYEVGTGTGNGIIC